MPRKTETRKPTPAEIEALHAEAQEYGYGVDGDARIILNSGKLSSCTIMKHGSGLRVVAHHGRDNEQALFTGSGIGPFLEKFWFATRKQ